MSALCGTDEGLGAAAMTLKAHKRQELPEAGELLAVEAIDPTGLVVTSEGAFVRVLRVTPPNPLILSAEDRQAVAAGFCHLIGRLRPEQSLQFYVQARPVRLEALLADARREVEAVAGPPPTRDRGARDPTALSRWRLYAAMEESLSQHADEQAAVELGAYVVIPYLPRQRVAHAALASLRRGRLLERAARARRRGAPAGGAREPGARRPAALGAGGARAARDPARRRAGGRAAVGALQPDQGGQRTAPRGERGRGAGRARHRRRPRAGAPGRARAARAHRRLEPGSQARAARRRGRPRPRAGHLLRPHRAPDHDGLADGRDDDAPAVHAERVRARARPPPRTPEDQARLPAAVRDQPRRRGARARARLRPLRPGARVPAAAGGDGRPRPRQRVPDLRLPGDPRPRPGAGHGVARRGRRLLRRAARVRVGLQGQPRRVPPARPVGQHAAARPRRRPPRAQVRHPQRRRHRPADRHLVRVADRDPVRLLRPGPDRRAAEPVRPRARQPHAAGLRQGRLGQDDGRQCDPLARDRPRRAGVRDRPRRPLRAAHPAGRGRPADRARRRRLTVRDQPLGRPRPARGVAGEDRVPDLAALAADGRRGPRQGGDRAAGRGDPRRLRQGRHAAKARRRASRCCATSCGRWPSTTRPRARSTSP